MERRKSLSNVSKSKETQVQKQVRQQKELLLSRLNKFKSTKKKTSAMSPRLGSNFAKNKENINNNLFTKVSQPQRPISKGKPQFLQLTNANDYSTKTDSSQLKGFLSNKGNEKIQLNCLAENNIICEGTSKDGQYHIQSKAFSGEQLKKAVEYEHKMNYKARKEKKENKEPKTPRSQKVGKVNESRTSTKQNGIIKGYAVNTNEGISRNYNEDRVSVILNITKNGIKSFFFAIYDGHGGSNCCDFLSDHLHEYILSSKKFPSQPRQAIVDGIKQAEENFLLKTKNDYLMKKQLDRSGSCIILALIVGDQCFVANVGDSRAILSTCSGKPLYSLSRDHKPTDTNEQERIMREGGKIYRTQMRKLTANKDDPPTIGPLRVYPGKLSITRTIGDIEAKEKHFGGLSNCIITDPEICKYKLNGKEDFIILGCDGIFEKMDSQQVIQVGWKAIQKTTTNVHEACGNAVQSILKTSMLKKSSDNVTAIMISLSDLGFTNTQDYKSI